MKKVILAIGTAAVFGTSVLLVSAGPVSFTTVSNIVSGQPARAADVVTAFNEIKTALETCPADMVKAGSMCVDKYEASVWDAAAGGMQIASADIAARCDVNGNTCSAADPTGAPRTATAIYARSETDVLPAVSITWYQAQQACANVGKRLLTNSEWQMAAAGTPDDVASCNVGGDLIAPNGVVGNTGAMRACVSNFGANDMVGNTSEMTADWVQGDTAFDASTPTDIGAGFGNDTATGTNASSNQGSGSAGLPSVVYRGGRGTTGVFAGSGAGVFAIGANVAPSFSVDNIGFRCGRSL